jgi:hypothetical protein
LAEAPGFAWEAVLAASYRTRTTALLYEALQGAAWVPADVRDRLHQVYLQAAVRHMRSTHAYAALLAALTDAGIDHLVFKGPVLTEVVYGNPALRSYTDLDMLVHRADLKETQAVLTGLGYTRQLGEAQPGAWDAFSGENAWGKTVGPLRLRVDLHWEPIGKIYGEMAWMWNHTQPYTMQVARTQVFKPEVRLLYLAAHLALRHGKFVTDDVLYLLYDVALIVRETDPALDWAQVLDLARAHRLALPLRAALQKTEAVWPLDLPTGVVTALAETRASRADAQAVAILTTEETHRIDTSRGFWFLLRRKTNWRDRGKLISSHLFPPWAYMAHRYRTRGPVHTALSYPYRWGYAAVSLLRMVGRMGGG